MFKRSVLLFLTTILCLGCLTSCFIVVDERDGKGVRTEPETAERAPVEKIPAMTDVLTPGLEEAEKALEGVFDGRNYEGKSFSVIIAEEADLNITAEQETSYVRALRLQSELISSKLGCTVYVTRTPYNTFLSDSQAAMNSGLFYTDLALVPQKGLGYLKSQNMLADLNALYGDVFTDDCYDLDSKDQTSGGNRTYGIAGNAAVTPGAYTCVYMNKTVADACGITAAVCEAVDNGSWTLDKLLEFRTQCAANYADISALGAVNAEILTEALFGASGMRYMNSSLGTLPAVAANGARLDSFIIKMRSIVFDASQSLCAENAAELFEQDKILFYVDTLEKASGLKENYTVLPLPKFDGGQDAYYTHTTADAYVFAVLTTNDHPETAIDLIRGFNETGGILHEALARDLLNYAFSNQDSYKYVKDIFKNSRYEFAYMFGEAYPSVAESSYNALKQAVLNNANFNYYVNGQTWRLRNDLNAIFG